MCSSAVSWSSGGDQESLCSRCSFAPLVKITLPRLELCGEALLVELFDRISHVFIVGLNNIYLRTDSISVLLWMSLPSTRLNTVVANRVAHIQNTTNLYSDNGATFIGAQQELREPRKHFASESHQSKFPELANSEAFTWHIIRPLDFKKLACAVWNITWMVGVTPFTFEEIVSLLTQVEEFLNSRTLTALSNDPHDRACLSPRHFLVVARLTSFPEPKKSALSVTRLGGSTCSGSYNLFW
jgi:hypothetical protein